MVLVLEKARLGERCHSLGERCLFLSDPGSLQRSVLRTTNGFGFIARACVVDFNVKWGRYTKEALLIKPVIAELYPIIMPGYKTSA